MSSSSPSGERLPAAAVRIWPAGEVEPGEELAQVPGLLQLSAAVFVVVPTAGQAAIFDLAVVAARRLLDAARRRRRRGGARALVWPATFSLDTRLTDDPTLAALERQPPELRQNGIYLAGLAANLLESGWALHEAGAWGAGPNPQTRLLRVGARRILRLPWRSPDALGAAGRAVARPELSAQLADLGAGPLALVQGPLGVGKSRAVWEWLQGLGEPMLWLRPDLGAAGLPLPTQLVRQTALLSRSLATDASENAWAELRRAAYAPQALAEALALVTWRWHGRGQRPLTVVFDGMEAVDRDEREFLDRLVQLPQLGRSLRLVLVGREGGDWAAAWPGAQKIAVPPLSAAEAAELARQRAAALGLPGPVAERIRADAGGNPFAFEEGLAGLHHGGHLRQIYGSFFFGGDAAAGFTPAPRWVAHVEAEARRLGDPAPLRALAAAEVPVPAAEVRAAAGGAESGAALWEAPFVAGGMLRRADSLWGPGVEPAYPAIGLALRATLPEERAHELRRALGASLAALSSRPRQSWEAYRLLAGTPEAAATLLAAAAGAPAEVPARSVLDAFTAELARLRREGVPGDQELELLWPFLPLAHRLGELEAHRGELDRARQLAGADPEKLLALAALQAALEEQSGALRRAEGSLRRALEAAVQRTADTDRKAALSIRLGRVLAREGRRDEARQLFERILPVVERSGRHGLAASCRFYLGNVALAEHRLEEARHQHEAALAVRRQKSPRAAGPSLTALGAVALALGNYPAALAYYQEAQQVLEGAADADLSYALLGLGRALGRLGDFAAAAGVLRRALGLRAEKSDATGEGIARLALAECYLRLEQPAVALREARQAHFRLSLGRESRYLGHAEALLGRILLRQRQPAAAREHFAAALRLHRDHHDPTAAAFDLAWALEAAMQREDREAVLHLGQELDAALADQTYPEQGELLDLHLYQALDWLRTRDPEAGNPTVYLRRAYQNLMRKTGFLAPDLRNRFLFQVPEHRELLAAANRCGLGLETPA